MGTHPIQTVAATHCNHAELLVHAAVYMDVTHMYSERGNEDFGTFFLEAKGKEAEYLKTLFQGHVPRVEIGVTYERTVFEGHVQRVKIGINNTFELENQPLMDKTTKKPAVIFTVRTEQLTRNRATVTAMIYGGYNRYRTYDYELIYASGKWTIIKVKAGIVS